MDTMADKVTYTQFGCIGSGFSAVALGATLQRWYGITDIRLFERDSALGGTWFANQYPGCACDVPSVLYSFSFAQNKRWSKVLASSTELRAYLNKVADSYNLVSKISFGHRVEKCDWVESTGRWRLTVRNVESESESDTILVHECQFLFSGTGILVTPKKCDIPGAETFAGSMFHTARWRHDVDLTDKNVVLVGNGCTAAQIVPEIVTKTKQLTQFVRSKHWYRPALFVPDSPRFRWMLEHVPGFALFVRFLVFAGGENDMRGMFDTPAGARFRKVKEKMAADYMKKTAPAKYHDMLIPDFPIGCKRRIYDPGYCRALHCDNLALSQDPIVEILPHGVRSKQGTVTDADVIVLATGFETNEYMHGITVTGRGGKTINQHWATFGGPEAYVNTAMSDFPNFFMILGHTSTVMAIENSVNYALRIIKPVLDGEAKFAVVKRAAEEKYSRETQAALKQTIWDSGCHSWYVKRLDNGTSWNSMTYPKFQWSYWYECLFPKYSDWVYPPTKNATWRRMKRRLLTLIKWALVLLATAGTLRYARLYWPILSNIVPLTKLAIMQARQKYGYGA